MWQFGMWGVDAHHKTVRQLWQMAPRRGLESLHYVLRLAKLRMFFETSDTGMLDAGELEWLDQHLPPSLQ